MAWRLWVYFISLIALLGASHAVAAELKIAVASNFATTAEALVEKFTQQSSHRVTLLVGSSGKHSAQIQYGLGVDVFMAADAARPKLLEEKGLVLDGSRTSYAQGRLVVWSADSEFFSASSISNKHLANILNSSGAQIVSIANPKIAPYGAAAEQVLDNLMISPRLVYGESVGQAFQFVNSGGAQLGLLALAQVKALGIGSYALIPEDLHEPIDQQLVIISDSESARQWRDFVLSETSQSVIESRGYRRAKPSDIHADIKLEAD